MTDFGDRVNQFADALEDGDTEAAEERAVAIAEDLERLTDQERVRLQQAILAQNAASDEERQTLNDHALSSVELALSEASFLMAALAAIEDPDGPDSAQIREIRNIGTELQQRSEAVDDAGVEADDVVGEYELPPQIVLADVQVADSELVVGEVTTIEVTLENVGSAPAENVELVSSADGGSIGPSTTTLGTGPGGSVKTVELTVEPTAGGQVVVRIRAEAANANGDSTQLLLPVDDTAETDNGDTNETVADSDGGDDDDTGDTVADQDGRDDDSFGPGLGVGGALIGVGGAAYLLKRRLTDEDSE